MVYSPSALYNLTFMALQTGIARLGWLAAPIGVLTAAFAVVTLRFLFALRDFSSAVRDVYEPPPGVTQYVVFSIACVGLLLLFVAGVVMVVLTVWRRGRLPTNSSGAR